MRILGWIIFVIVISWELYLAWFMMKYGHSWSYIIETGVSIVFLLLFYPLAKRYDETGKI